MGTPGWPEADIEDLKRTWTAESTAKIASRLGRTRNAVIGMAHRLGLPRKAPSGNPHPRRKPSSPRKAKPPKKVAPKPPIQKPVDNSPVSLMEAGISQCRAVIESLKDENGFAMVCGKPIVEGQSFSFCSEHLQRFTTQRGYRDVTSDSINKKLQ